METVPSGTGCAWTRADTHHRDSSGCFIDLVDIADHHETGELPVVLVVALMIIDGRPIA
jgi:hypothetical protein